MEDQFFGAAALRVTPEAIPALREAMQKTLDELAIPISKLQMADKMTDAWLKDPVSESVMAAYNTHVIEAPDGMFRALIKYRDQIKATVTALDEAEKRYQRNEGDLRDLVVKYT